MAGGWGEIGADTGLCLIWCGRQALKLRAETTQEAERWINGLYDWANYHRAASAGADNSRAGLV